MRTAIVTLSREGIRIAQKLREEMDEAELFVHRIVRGKIDAQRFDQMAAVSRTLFQTHKNIIYIAPCGAVVRVIAPLLKHKTKDPAVVVIDAGGRYAVSLLSGHEGGANELAFRVANIIGAEPVISTTTEAVKDIIVGVGCRRGTNADVVVSAVKAALRRKKIKLNRVRVLASADVKKNEPGIHEAARELGVNLRFISSQEILASTRKFKHSSFVLKKINLPAVAEPSALLGGRRTTLLLPKTILHGMTVAIAQENFL